mmetsp:Transcript_30835/g.44873  ORF Transcript_30835/g.44873 Transcript_30835/m.44873 type:complete len:1098 (-) Transcript_30835:303-3596(-)
MDETKTSVQSSLFPASKKCRAQIDTVCLGTGRFLRSVLIPPLLACEFKPVIIQTRGRSFLEYCVERYDNKNKTGKGKEESEGDFLITYEVDTVEYDGKVTSEEVGCYGAGTMGSKQGIKDVLSLLNDMDKISIIGMGVTEAGLSSPKCKTMADLAQILHRIYTLLSSSSLTCPNPNGKICILNTDNVPQNGTTIYSHMKHIATNDYNEEPQFLEFLETKVAFCDSMVDRITSQRPGSNGLVPRCEPIPNKCLVVEDLHADLPNKFYEDDMKRKFGFVIRTKPNQLSTDIDLKLRVANGTHTAVAHVMSISSILQTTAFSSSSSISSLLLQYLDSFFEQQILQAATTTGRIEKDSVQDVYADWRRRLTHSTFGLSTFFITQNGAAKGGIRIGPSIRDLILGKKSLNVTTSFAMACILRFLTPSDTSSSIDGVYRGRLDTVRKEEEENDKEEDKSSAVMYADGLQYDLENKWYEFRCSCLIPSAVSSAMNTQKDIVKVPLPDALASLSSKQAQSCQNVIRHYLVATDGGNLSDLVNKEAFEDFVMATSVLYARMVAGDGALEILRELISTSICDGKKGLLDVPCAFLIDGSKQVRRRGGHRHIAPLRYKQSFVPNSSHLLKTNVNLDDLASVVSGEVSSTEVIDLHTHLLPPSHGSLCLWGIDELLTYHYLVAEYFMTAPASVAPEQFYALSKQKQADIIWKALFLDRSPVSEACRGVITTLKTLGLQRHIDARDLDAIRLYYETFRSDGLDGVERFSEMVYRSAGVRYAVMTNIPFDANEVQHWRPKRKEYPEQYKSALRVDPLLAGDRNTVETALRGSGYDVTLEGARQYLRDWCETMKPEYMMASTPHNFVLNEDRVGESVGGISGVKKTGVNEDAMKQPFAFVGVTNPSGSDCAADCGGDTDVAASVIDENSNFLSEVLMKVCEERDLPVALKIGAHRGINPKLLQAGDGVVAFADAGVLARLCTRFPNVRFLATFLSKNNQHEACVLASKFRNLHIYGCWWFCNNPSMIEEITTMRVEMLGTAFTAQHSDARVLDQLLYKWSHSRAVIADVLTGEYEKLVEAGWSITREEIRRDVRRLFGGSYEEFMSKSFLPT